MTPVGATSRARNALLSCGVLSPALYAAADAIAGMSWPAYVFRDQTISELGAIGAPTRALFSVMLVPVYLCLLGFGLGVWRAGAGRAGLSVAGILIVAEALLALAAGQFVPMMPRGVEQGARGALHLIEGAVAMALVFSAMICAAIALGTRFRAYTGVTLGVALAFGAWSGLDAPAVAAGLATPWLGVKERVFWYGYQAWFAVLAVALMRQPAPPGGAPPSTARA